MKTQLLIEKYGLSAEVAKHIVFQFEVENLLRVNINPKSDPDKNKAVIREIIESDPSWYKPAPKVYALNHKLTQIDFVINGITHTIDDLLLIDQIRQLISKNEFDLTPKYRKITTRPHLNNLAQYIFENLPESSMYKKQIIVGKIFGEFLKEYQSLTDDKLISKVKNLKNK
jgi:hypothetical protein